MRRNENVRKPNGQREVLEVDIWGARGSRSVTPPTSTIANYTSCYSVRCGDTVFVFDGGRGLGVFSRAMQNERRFANVATIQLLLSHSHMDHWEGLKDADWFWKRGDVGRLWIWGPDEAQRAITQGYAHPSYVPLEILSLQKLDDLQFRKLKAWDRRQVRGWQFGCFPLNHYSGMGKDKKHLNALGFRLRTPQGAVISYLCDHEPTDATERLERQLVRGATLAIVDAHFADRKDQAFGHGSVEHAASLARTYPETMVLSAHHGPMMEDDLLRDCFASHGKGLRNFALAIEGERWRWNGTAKRFRRRKA